MTQDEKYNQELENAFKAMDQDELDYLEDVINESALYETVLSQLNLPEDDVLYRNFVGSLLKNQLKNHMVLTIWQNFKPNHIEHFRDYVDQAAVLIPGTESDEIILGFALMYPDLKKKLFEGITEFLKKFIVDFNASEF